MKKLKLLSKYKYKSIFFKSLFILATFSLLSIIIFSSFSFKLVTKTFQEKNNVLYTNVLNNAKNAVDYSLKDLHNVITHTSSERSIINAVVSPHSANNSNDLEVLDTLLTLRKENELIDDVYLYIPANEKVITSRYKIVTRELFSNKDILERYYKNPNAGSVIELNGRITRILLYDSNIYLVRDFPLGGNRRLGTIFVKLNTNKFYNVLQGQGVNYSNNLFIYYSTNKPVFPSYIKYGDSLNQYLKIRSQEGEGMALANHKRYFYTESPITQLRFLFVMDDTSLMPSVKQILSSVLPLGVCIFIICFLLGLFLINQIYSPIKHLVSNVENVSLTSALTSSINEFDYLSGTFNNVINKYNELDHIIKNVLPDVSKKLFNDLLTGTPMETSYIKNTLESISSPLDTKGVYNVMLLKLEESAPTDVVDPFLIAVARILNEKAINTCKYHIQMIEKSILAIILEFDKNMSELSLKLLEIEIEKNILSKSQNFHLDILLEKGKIYHSIQESQFSYEEALQQLILRKHRSEEPPKNVSPLKIEQLHQLYYNKDYFTIRTKKIYDLIFNNNDEGALILAKQISKTITKSDNSIENIKLFFRIYIDTILDNMLNFNVNKSGNIFISMLETNDNLNITNDLNQMQKYMDSFCEQAIILTNEYCKKQHHKYIVAAKKYIEAHYSDPNLSLSEVAEYINTNSCYLSKLFKENLNINFNNYLNSYRIEKVKSLLDTTEMTLKEVATATGFNSQQNFIRVFKKFEGITPGRY